MNIRYTTLFAFVVSSSPALALTTSYVAPGFGVSTFATLPLQAGSLAFDPAMNLYVESTQDNFSGRVEILKLDASSGYSVGSVYGSYATDNCCVSGIDYFNGSIYVAEVRKGGNAGQVGVMNSKAEYRELIPLYSARPTGIDARGGNVLFPVRMESQPDAGSVNQLKDGIYSQGILGIPFTGIASDADGDIYVSTRGSDFLSEDTGAYFAGKSIYRLAASSGFDPAAAQRIVSFNEGGIDELAEDSSGNLYALHQGQGGSEVILVSSLIMPVPNPAGGGFAFNSSGSLVIDGQQFRGGFYDPDVAVGYIFEATGRNTLFDKVMIPNRYGNGKFDLLVWDEASQSYVDANVELSTGVWFDFSDGLGVSGGLRKFRIAGIETSALIDPEDPNGFVTGLAFVGSESRFVMTPLTEFVATAPVPEPEAYAMLLLGFGLVVTFARRANPS